MSRTAYTIRHFSSSLLPSGKVIPYLSFFEEYSDSPLKRCTIYPTRVSSISFCPSTASSICTAVLLSCGATRQTSYLTVSKPHQGRMSICPLCGFLLTTLKSGSPVWLVISSSWQTSVQQQQFSTVFSLTRPTKRYWYFTWTVGLSYRLRQQLFSRMPSQGVCWQQSKPVMLHARCEAGRTNRWKRVTSSSKVKYTSPSSLYCSSVEMSSYQLARSQGMKGRPTGRGMGKGQLQYLRGSGFWLRMKYRWSLSPLQSNIITI